MPASWRLRPSTERHDQQRPEEKRDRVVRPDELIDRLQQAVEEMLTEIDRLQSTDVYASSAAEAWSVTEILAHVVEMLPYWAEQAQAVAARAQDGEPFGRTHESYRRGLRRCAITRATMFGNWQLACARRSIAVWQRCAPSRMVTGSARGATPAAVR